MPEGVFVFCVLMTVGVTIIGAVIVLAWWEISGDWLDGAFGMERVKRTKTRPKRSYGEAIAWLAGVAALAWVIWEVCRMYSGR